MIVVIKDTTPKQLKTNISIWENTTAEIPFPDPDYRLLFECNKTESLIKEQIRR